ncbi:Os06g0542350 [Oryza sativa Japonica Group]|uniref:Os06g0542350 protein n=1 Tax=Oryza sativa subsp. japonica TaxID=39947 RepID=A0A0P0WXZ4_ORYSJ|nr:hypothetical protein EE612_034733 [Oryza sativa]BAS98134.1 Os06g0542350 [Oryza sativa Japonica Group]
MNEIYWDLNFLLIKARCISTVPNSPHDRSNAHLCHFFLSIFQKSCSHAPQIGRVCAVNWFQLKNTIYHIPEEGNIPYAQKLPVHTSYPPTSKYHRKF